MIGVATALAGPPVPEADVRGQALLDAIRAEQLERICTADQLFVGRVVDQRTYHRKSANPLNARHPGFDLADVVLAVEADGRGSLGASTTITVPAARNGGGTHLYNVPVPYETGERWLVATREVRSRENEWHAFGSFAPTLLVSLGEAEVGDVAGWAEGRCAAKREAEEEGVREGGALFR